MLQPTPRTASVSAFFSAPTEVSIGSDLTVSSSKPHENESASILWQQKQYTMEKTEITFSGPKKPVKVKPIKPWRRSLQQWKRGKDVSKTYREITSILNKCTLKQMLADKLVIAWNEKIKFVQFTYCQIMNRVQKEPMLARLYIEVVNMAFVHFGRKKGSNQKSTWRLWIARLMELLASRVSIGFLDELNAKIIYSKASKRERDVELAGYKKSFPGIVLDKHKILDDYMKEAVQEEAKRLERFRQHAMVGYLRILSELLKLGLLYSSDQVLDQASALIPSNRNGFVLTWLRVLEEKMYRFERVEGYYEDRDVYLKPTEIRNGPKFRENAAITDISEHAQVVTGKNFREPPRWKRTDPQKLACNKITTDLKSVPEREFYELGQLMGLRAAISADVIFLDLITNALKHWVDTYSLRITMVLADGSEWMFRMAWILQAPYQYLRQLTEALDCKRPMPKWVKKMKVDLKAEARIVAFGYLMLLEAMKKKELIDITVRSHFGHVEAGLSPFYDSEYAYLKQVHLHIVNLENSLQLVDKKPAFAPKK
ncbi:hypothetical protein L596_009509 [Steinernema carpocapsae]|uniref:Uncharacterized protein n=1 Tax=Steinernema carpocapsae TaxID=34508 RepID=A0A4V6A6L1_STECR|nr:hypothetical protein L596_009509 [Steinernema carpocapsae]